MTWLFILLVGLVAGTLSGIVGFGSSLIMLPILVFSFGPKAAVPIMAVAALLANLSRVVVWWRQIDWLAAGSYSLTAIPAAALGARTLLTLDARLIEIILGAFFIAMVPLRRWFISAGLKISLAGLALAGAVIGYLTGIVATTGPINTPFFLAYGLVKGPYISTEALGSLAVFATKSLVFWQGDALPREAIMRGLIVGSSLMAGSWLAKQFVQRMEAEQFRFIMDGLMLTAGLAMLIGAFV